MVSLGLICILCSFLVSVESKSIFSRVFGRQKGPTRSVLRRELVIIGSGPAGATAAIYAARAMLKPLQIAGYNAGGQLILTSDVENFPGYRNPITGPDLIEDLNHQARKFGTEVWQTDVTGVDFSKSPFILTLHNCTVLADAVIISTGANSIWLNAEREADFQGKGISTCATCDGYLFRDKRVVVVGGGDSAMEEANFLSRFAKTVTIIHRSSTFRASKIMLERARSNPKVHFVCNAQVVAWRGEGDVLSGLTYKDTVTGDEHKIDCEGAFIAIGHKPNTAFLQNQVALDGQGYVLLEQHTMTSVPGVFACGDVADTRYKQAITAAGTGCQAAMDAEKWLEQQKA